MPSGDTYHCARYSDGTLLCANIQDPRDIISDSILVSDYLNSKKWIASEEHDRAPRDMVGKEILAFNDTTVEPLASIPPAANNATFQVLGGDVRVDFSGAALAAASVQAEGFRLTDGSFFDLESLEELTSFQCIGESGSSGNLIVRYYLNV